MISLSHVLSLKELRCQFKQLFCCYGNEHLPQAVEHTSKRALYIQTTAKLYIFNK